MSRIICDMGRQGPSWLIFGADAVPEKWRERALSVRLVPLLPGEVDDLAGGSALPGRITIEEERILRLLGEGRTVAQIAKRMEMSIRSVERRLASLRDRFGVESTAALGVWLGMGGSATDE